MCLEGRIQESRDYFCLSGFIYPDMDPIYVVPTVLLTDGFTELAVRLGNSGKAFVALWLLSCASMSRDGAFSSTDR